MKRLPYLDLLRALGALAVLLCHAWYMCVPSFANLSAEQQTLPRHFIYYLFVYGIDAVVYFFIISGMLVGGRWVEKALHGKASLKDYVLNRTSRIYPPLFCVIIIITAINVMTGTSFTVWDIIGQFFGLQGVCVPDYGGVFWTLAYEVWFYVFIAGVISVVSMRNKLIGSYLIVLSVAVILSINPVWFAVILLGMLAYYIKDKDIPKWLVIAAIIIWVVLRLLSLMRHSASFPMLKEIMNEDICRWISAVCVVLIVVRLLNSQPIGWKSTLDRFGSKIAPFSYSLFLTHYQVLRLFEYYHGQAKGLDAAAVSYFLLNCIVSILVAVAFYYVTEKHTKKIENKLNKIFR